MEQFYTTCSCRLVVFCKVVWTCTSMYNICSILSCNKHWSFKSAYSDDEGFLLSQSFFIAYFCFFVKWCIQVFNIYQWTFWNTVHQWVQIATLCQNKKGNWLIEGCYIKITVQLLSFLEIYTLLIEDYIYMHYFLIKNKTKKKQYLIKLKIDIFFHFISKLLIVMSAPKGKSSLWLLFQEQ